MTTLSPDFKKNLESAILENGRFACPNIACTDWITSKEIIKNNGSKFLEYHCKNPKCIFHAKEIVPLEEKKQELVFETNSSGTNTKRLLVGFASILLILTVAFGGYFPKAFSSDSSTNISPKKAVKAEAKKRTIVLSTPVFREEK